MNYHENWKPGDEIERLTAEVERYKAALREITGIGPSFDAKGTQSRRIDKIARRALDGKEGCPACEIERLTDELAEKDKRIEQYEREDRVCDAAYAALKANPPKVQLIPDAKINEAWGQKYFYDGVDGPLIRANLVGIVACEKCGGSGGFEDCGTPFVDCPSCHGQRWVMTSVDVDKYGQIGTSDAAAE